ncbi:MAG: hypothetical protein ACE1ZN_05485 [Dehalococcoidia bacterium]
MGRSEFEEIFEECLSALLEGRRSIEESLSLYPAWRGRLEPLLRAAEEIAASLNEVPPPHVKERGLQRFLEAARMRRRLQRILSIQAERKPWWRWASAGLAATVVIGVLTLMSVTLMAEDGERLSRVSVSVSPYFALESSAARAAPVQTPLEVVQEQVAVLEDSVRDGESVGVAFLEALEEADNDLAADLDSPEDIALMERVAAVSVASRQYELLQKLQGQSSGEQARAVEASLTAAEGVLEKLGATPTPSPEPIASPSPTPTPAPTPSAVGTAAPSPTPAE